MVVVWILCAIIGLIILLLCIPLWLLVAYDGGAEETKSSLELTLKYFFIPIQLVPKPEKKQKPPTRMGRFWSRLKGALSRMYKKIRVGAKRLRIKLKRLLGIKSKAKTKPKTGGKQESEKDEKKPSAIKQLTGQRGVSGFVELIFVVLRIAGGTFGKIFRGIIIKRLKIHIKIGGDDPADTAVKYGALCGVLFPAIAMIIGVARTRHKDVLIEPDFNSPDNMTVCEGIFVVIPIMVVGYLIEAALKLFLSELKRSIKEKVEENMKNAGKQA